MALPRGADPRDAVRNLDALISEGVPYTAFQYITVTFPSSANTDLVIPHALETDDVDWQVVGWTFGSAPATTPAIYRDTSGTARAWTNTYLVLRCNVASVAATLLLTVRRT